MVVTDNNPGKAQKYTDELLEFAWNHRADWVYQIEPLERSLARAAEVKEGPVVLLDHYDNAASGGTMDTMTVLGGDPGCRAGEHSGLSPSATRARCRR